MSGPWRGAGIGYRHAHRAALLARTPSTGGPAVLEVMPDHFFASPGALAPLAERYPIVFHDVGLSFATAGDTSVARDRLRRIAELAAIARPLLVSDHLALTRSPAGIDLGHLAPVWRTEAALALIADRLRAVADLLQLPVAIENITAPFDIPGGMPEAEFLARLVERAGCGLLLDLANLEINGRNHGFDARARVHDYPLEAVVQVHLAGGFRDRAAVWIDSHSTPVADTTFELLRELGRARASLVTIIVERDDNLGDLGDLVAEATAAAARWTA
ncbi:MAG: DUF692 domain-containing protein [Deltaproteobacteria bacterium]|nr:DUF692 domain-containing protein [Deltaproteobacteria bacterium]